MSNLKLDCMSVEDIDMLGTKMTVVNGPGSLVGKRVNLVSDGEHMIINYTSQRPHLKLKQCISSQNRF